MTTPSGTELTDEQLSSMVATQIGWICGENGWIHPNGLTPKGLPWYAKRPSLSTSRDACATFEATITDRRTYNMNLEEAVREDFPDWRIMDPEERFFEVITATPRQRCIAFLRMKGVL